MPGHLQLLRQGPARCLERGSWAGSPGLTELQAGREKELEGGSEEVERGGTRPPPHKAPLD